MPDVNVFCEVPYLYRTKVEMGWGGVDYCRLLSKVQKETGCASVGRSVAAVKKGPRQGNFLGALGSFGFDIALGQHVDRSNEVLPCWDQLCYEASLNLVRGGPQWLALFGRWSSPLADVSCFALDNWGVNVLYASFDESELEEAKENTHDFTDPGVFKTMLIDDSICKG